MNPWKAQIPVQRLVGPFVIVSGIKLASAVSNFSSKLFYVIAVIGFLVSLWQGLIWLFQPAPFLLPTPAKVAGVLFDQWAYLSSNALTTIVEMVLGFLVGSFIGVLVALMLSHFTMLDRYLMPIVVVTQTLPVFAIAPLLVIWFGFGLGSKIVMASLIIFFPVTSAFYDGLKQTPKTYLDLGKSWGAGTGQLLGLMRIPAAMPSLMTGLKVAATIAPIGAVVGEWAGASGGLGFVMLQANARTQTDVVFASLILLALCAWGLRFVVVQITDRVLWWNGQSAAA